MVTGNEEQGKQDGDPNPQGKYRESAVLKTWRLLDYRNFLHP